MHASIASISIQARILFDSFQCLKLVSNISILLQIVLFLPLKMTSLPTLAIPAQCPNPAVNRPIANFRPNMWGDQFLVYGPEERPMVYLERFSLHRLLNGHC